VGNAKTAKTAKARELPTDFSAGFAGFAVNPYATSMGRLEIR
jgi:hypothetical protein